MNNVTAGQGWQRLPNGYDVEVWHGIPVRVSDNVRGLTVPGEVLQEEISALGRLHVSLGDWEPGGLPGEHEARVFVSGREFTEVLRRLALASAALFVERYHKPISAWDVDWDRLEYIRDFNIAREICRLDSAAVDRDEYFGVYAGIMHRESHRLVQSGELRMVAPE